MARHSADPIRLADHAQAALWFVAPSLPVFLIIPAPLRAGVGFWLAPGTGCATPILLYLVVVWAATRLGINM